MADLWAKQSVASLLSRAKETEAQAVLARDGVPLKRSLTATNLVALGIGAIIGAGIFVLTGHAAAENAGPAFSISFVLSGIACSLAGPVLRRDGVERSGRRQRLHLCLRDARRNRHMDHRLGSDPGLFARRYNGRDRLVRWAPFRPCS
jgi:hypothetical protein